VLPFAALLVVALAMLTGCASTDAAVTAANIHHAAATSAGEVLHDVCTVGYEHAEREAAHALRAMRTSHAAVAAARSPPPRAGARAALRGTR
jgi:uncharacterized protein YgiB involved in biofilm formation